MVRRKILLLVGLFILVGAGLSFLYSYSLVMAAAPTLAPDAADLQISASAAPDPVTVGDPLTYALIVRNVGPSIAFSVTVQDRLPTGLNFSGVSSIQTLGGTGSNLLLTPTTLTGTVSILQPGGIITITGRTLVGLTATGSTLVNPVSVSAANDDNPANNDATVTTQLLPLPATATPSVTPTLTPTPLSTPTSVAAGVDLRLSKRSAPDSVRPGQPLTYTIVVRNVGSLAAQNLVLTDTLPTGVNFAGATNISVERGFAPTIVLTGTTLTGRTQQLNPGGLLTITSRTLVAVDVSAATLVNSAGLTANTESGVRSYHTSVNTTVIRAITPTGTPQADPLPNKVFSPLIQR